VTKVKSGLAGSGWVWLDLAGWLGMAGSGWVWLDLAGYGWIWLGMAGLPLDCVVHKVAVLHERIRNGCERMRYCCTNLNFFLLH